MNVTKQTTKFAKQSSRMSNLFDEVFMIQRLLDLLNHKETMILIYSHQGDEVRVKELQDECKAIDAKLLDLYTQENEAWLKTQLVRLEA